MNIYKVKKTLEVEFKKNTWLYRLVLVSFIVRVLYIFIFSTPDSYLITDMGAYNERALNLVSGNPHPFANYWAPFFHIFLAAIYWPLEQLDMMEYKVRISVAIFALLGSISIISIYKITKKLFNEKAAKFSAVVYAFWYPLIYLNIFLLSENLFVPLLYLGLYLYYCHRDYKHSDLLIGFVLGLATITRPAILIFIGLFGLWLVIRKKFKFLIGFSIAFLFIIGLMSIFNQKTTLGTTKLISSGNGMNFTMEWCDAKSLEYFDGSVKYGFAPPANSRYPDSKRLFTSEPFYNEMYYYKMGLECIKDNPSAIYKNIRSVKNTFDSVLFPNFVNIFAWKPIYSIFKVLNIGLFATSLFSLLKLSRKKIYEEIAPLLFLIIAIFVSVYIFNPGEERYLIPFTPIFIIISSRWITSLDLNNVANSIYDKFFAKERTK